MTIYDLIFRSGGFDDEIYRKSTYLNRADLIRYDGDLAKQKIIPFNLSDVLEKEESALGTWGFSSCLLKKYFLKTSYVSISGSINNDDYIHKKDMTLYDLILEAGGLSDYC